MSATDNKRFSAFAKIVQQLNVVRAELRELKVAQLKYIAPHRRIAPPTQSTSFSINALHPAAYRPQASCKAHRKKGRGYTAHAAARHRIALFPAPTGFFAKVSTAVQQGFPQMHSAPHEQPHTLATWDVPALYVNPYSVPSLPGEPRALASSLFPPSQQPAQVNSYGEDAAFLLQDGGEIGPIVSDKLSNCAEDESLGLSEKWLHPGSPPEKPSRRRSTKTAVTRYTLDASRSQLPPRPRSAHSANNPHPRSSTPQAPHPALTLRHTLDPVFHARPPPAAPLLHALDPVFDTHHRPSTPSRSPSITAATSSPCYTCLRPTRETLLVNCLRACPNSKERDLLIDGLVSSLKTVCDANEDVSNTGYARALISLDCGNFDLIFAARENPSEFCRVVHDCFSPILPLVLANASVPVARTVRTTMSYAVLVAYGRHFGFDDGNMRAR
ncbi:hypothetical protein AAVH_19806 [Aphelenchoides avenae]|nr:hypothetical protein AAVH_19806 [Aphelenchus avenae]